MSSDRVSQSEFAVLTLISSTQAVRIVRKQSRWKTDVSAFCTVFSDNSITVLENGRYCIRGKNADPHLFGDRVKGFFYLEFLPGKQDAARLVIRMNGNDGGQLLADADLQPFSPMLPGVFRASAKVDWAGRELLFPPAASAALWQTGSAEKMAFQFGCTDSMSRLRYGYCRSGNHIYAVPSAIRTHVTSLPQTPLTDPVPLSAQDPLRGMIRFGRWSVLTESEPVHLLGFAVSANQ